MSNVITFSVAPLTSQRTVLGEFCREDHYYCKMVDLDLHKKTPLFHLRNNGVSLTIINLYEASPVQEGTYCLEL
jgi:hypothetical protein